MKNKFQNMLAGVILTLIVIVGALFVFTRINAQANSIPQGNISVQENNLVESTSEQPIDDHIRPEITNEQKVDNSLSSSTINEVAQITSENVDEGENELILEDTTNQEAIVHTVKQLAERQEAALLGQTGWVHVQSSFYTPDEFRGNGMHSLTTDEIVPMEELVPNLPQTEDWYHVNKEGIYYEGIGLITNPDGVIHQQTILKNGQWINLTLKANSFAPEQYTTPVAAPEKVLLPIARASQQLEVKLTWSNVEMQATLDGDKYIVVVEQRYDAPIEDAIFMPEPVIGIREIFIFDIHTGQLSIEVQNLLESQTWLFMEKWEYGTVEFVAELPSELAQLFNSAVIDLQEEE